MIRLIYRHHNVYIRLQTAIWAGACATAATYLLVARPQTALRPQTVHAEPVRIEVVEPTKTPSPTPDPYTRGLASYYSREGCIGCREDMLMANGKPLDDSKLTVAYNRAKLGTKLEVTSETTGRTVVAEVTDRGGFERHGKIIDLSVATKGAIGCGDVCRVKVREL